MKSSNLKLIIERIQNHTLEQILQEEKGKKQKSFSADIQLMIAIKPMLARQFNDKNYK